MTSPQVIYASHAGAILDSNVLTGKGTDDTAALQAVLDRAPELGWLHLIVDGAALVRGLTIYSNTTIECRNQSCGFFLADGADRSLLWNAHPSESEIVDRNITLIGGTYNGNAAGQVHHTDDNRWVTGMDFFGVAQLSIRNIIIRDQRTFAAFIANFQYVHMENISILLEDPIQEGNQDGLHFCGPGQFLTLRNIQGCSWDDFIALNADDGHTYYTESGELAAKDWPYIGFGPITDVLIDGVILDKAAQGIRFLSRTSLIDRVVVRNITGTYRSFGFFMDPFWSKGGNFGNIVFDTVDLRAIAPNYTYMPNFLFALGGHHECVTLRNIYNFHAEDARRVLYIEDDAEIDALHLDGFYVTEGGETPPGASQIIVNGHVKRMVVHHAHIQRPQDAAPAGTLLEVVERAAPHGIDHLLLDTVVADRLANIIHLRGGEIGLLQVDNVVCTGVGEAIIRVDGGAVNSVSAGHVFGAELLQVNESGRVTA